MKNRFEFSRPWGQQSPGRGDVDQNSARLARLIAAEQKGLKLAILCRTLTVALALAWFVLGSFVSGFAPNALVILILFFFTLLGIVNLAVIGTRHDRWWLKYFTYTVDILGVCALFVFLPLSSGADVPQILAFRAYGIYYLFPFVGMACLSLSWRLVAWSGMAVVLGWWSAFLYVAGGMETTVSWGDLGTGASRADYERVFLSVDFIGVGNRFEETGFFLVTALILALAVYRARGVFLAQLEAEEEREAERAARERITQTLGRFVPEAVANKLINDPQALVPQVRTGIVLIMDIEGFTSFSEERPPVDVITVLNDFLAEAATVIGNHSGVVITFTGDGLLATFNTPLEVDRPEEAALNAARDLVAVALSRSFNVRIGLASGPIAAGSVGSERRSAFTVYGDTVNRAARLEAKAKDFEHNILLDRDFAAGLGDRSEIVSLGIHNIRGLSEEKEIFAVQA